MTDKIDSNPNSDVNGDGKQPGADRTFTQAELNEVLNERIRREREKFKDYDALKTAATQWQELQEKQKSEEQKLREQLAREQAEKQAITDRANKRLIEAAFIQEATLAGVQHPRDAYALALADGLQFELTENGETSGVKEAIAKLMQSGRLPLSKQRAPNLDGGAGGGDRATDRAAQLSDAEKVIARKMGLTDEQYAKAKI